MLFVNGGSSLGTFSLVFVYDCLIQDEDNLDGLEDPNNDPPVVIFHSPGNSEIKSADAKLQISSSV